MNSDGYGTTADLNELELKLQQEGVPMVEHVAEDFYDHTVGHLLADWMVLIMFAAGFLSFGLIALKHLSKEQA